MMANLMEIEAKVDLSKAQANKLLNPGPVSLSPRVRAALLAADLCHREPEYAQLQNEIRSGLINVYAGASDQFTAILLTGSGSAAVEAMVGSFVPIGGEALVMVNGVYGERMAMMLKAQGKKVWLASSEWGEPLNLAAAAQILAAQPAITHVLAVHHETTTGRLNDIGALSEICSKFNRPILLDAVSSFGGEKIDFNQWPLAACASTANKCLHGVPGISFVLARRELMETAKSGATSLYLDLFRHYREQQQSSTLFTPAVQVCYALAEALTELAEQGGWYKRHILYQALSLKILVALQELNFEPLLGDAAPSSAILTAYKLPLECRYEKLHDYLKEHGFVIYGGQGELARNIFRIAVMGDFDGSDADRLLALFQQFASH